ncbi:MAG TPA: lipase secretion chaperone [Steroidobacteraceae bacterium]|nr:lipase secretion chaperone [Steroidobacteraceae bacterium]
MNKRNGFLIALLVVLALVGGFALFRSEAPVSAPSESKTVAVAPDAPRAAAQGPQAERTQNAAPAMSGDATQATDSAIAAVPDDESDQDDGEIGFKADSRGDIVLNENTRLDLERLHALYSPADREKKLQEVSATLPPAAASQLHQLMDQYKNYQAAAYQAYPPDREMTSVEQGVSQIDGMHGLRVQFFGEEATEKMFGAEEKAQRALYKLMENENDPGLTVQEKAERAQQLYLEQQRQ